MKEVHHKFSTCRSTLSNGIMPAYGGVFEIMCVWGEVHQVVCCAMFLCIIAWLDFFRQQIRLGLYLAFSLERSYILSWHTSLKVWIPFNNWPPPPSASLHHNLLIWHRRVFTFMNLIFLTTRYFFQFFLLFGPK